MLTRGLLFKGLAAGAAIGGLGVAIHQRKNIASLLSPSSGKKKVWGELECGEADGSECSIKNGGKILIKKDGSNSFEVTSLGEGKIKVYKVEDSTYSEGFKFIIEDNDIGSGTNKLEEFETYEIKLGADSESDVNLKGKHYLSRKTDAKTEIKNALGLSCDLPTSASQDCTITNNKVGSVAISGGTVTLTISTETSKDEYPLGYKFTFKNTVDANATLTFWGETITLKKNSPVDFKIKKEGSSLSLEKAWTLEELTKKVGLKKENEEGYWTVDSSGINVKQDSNKETGRNKDTNQKGKIKLYKEQEGYNEGFKFSIENGDLGLKYKQNSTTKLLGQYETYEIKKDEDGNWYLTRKDGGQAKIKELLGLPCELPKGSNESAECSISTSNIGTIKFEGGTATISGSPKLTISGGNSRDNYPLGYKFTFTSSSETDSSITIPTSTTLTLKKNLNIDFKIKRKDDGGLTLEKAWTADSLIREASLKKDNKSDDWWVVGSSNISVKQDDNKTDDATGTGTQKAKIRVNEGAPGYNQGFKFVVEEGDTNLTEGNGINKLSRYETYEVVKDEKDGQWYFTRKQKSADSIKERLGLPNNCEVPASANGEVECALDSEEKLKAIKFEGKGEGTVSVGESNYSDLKLKIRNNGNMGDEFGGYKFTLKTSKDVTIPQPSGSSPSSITIKGGVDMEFKIKESSGSLTLERMWTPERLGKKLGLSCSSTGGQNKCSFGEKINVWDAENNYVDGASISADHKSKQLTFEENADDHNQGIKFTLDEDISLSGGTPPSGGTTVSTISKKNGNTPTYEIAQKTPSGGTAKWYLVKKTN